jgi:acyl carrier protein
VSEHWDDNFESTIRQSLPYLSPEAPLGPDADLRDLGLDSVQMVGVLIAVENEYDIQFPDEMLTEETFASPGNLWRAVRSLTGTSETAG